MSDTTTQKQVFFCPTLPTGPVSAVVVMFAVCDPQTGKVEHITAQHPLAEFSEAEMVRAFHALEDRRRALAG